MIAHPSASSRSKVGKSDEIPSNPARDRTVLDGIPELAVSWDAMKQIYLLRVRASQVIDSFSQR